MGLGLDLDELEDLGAVTFFGRLRVGVGWGVGEGHTKN